MVKNWSDGDYVSGDQMDDLETGHNLMFADAAARDAALVGDLAPFAGMTVFTGGVGWQVYNGSAWVTFLATTGVAPVAAPYAAGTSTFTYPANAANSGNIAVTFPAGRFAVAPAVAVSISSAPGGSQKLIPHATSISTTGFTLILYTGDQSNASASSFGINVDWVAVTKG